MFDSIKHESFRRRRFCNAILSSILKAVKKLCGSKDFIFLSMAFTVNGYYFKFHNRILLLSHTMAEFEPGLSALQADALTTHICSTKWFCLMHRRGTIFEFSVQVQYVETQKVCKYR
jgi:hypothetical protein